MPFSNGQDASFTYARCTQNGRTGLSLSTRFWYQRGNLLVLFDFQVGILPKTAGGFRAFFARQSNLAQKWVNSRHLHFQCQSTPQYDIIHGVREIRQSRFGKLKLRLAGRIPEILRHQRTAADKLVCGCINLDTPCCAFIGDCRRSSGGAQLGVSFANQRTRLLGCVRKV